MMTGYGKYFNIIDSFQVYTELDFYLLCTRRIKFIKNFVFIRINSDTQESSVTNMSNVTNVYFEYFCIVVIAK